MAANGLCESIDEFLNQCEQSGDSAYSAFRSLLERLEDPNTRAEARIFLSDLQKRFDTKESSEQCLQTFHFLIQDLYLEQYEDLRVSPGMAAKMVFETSESCVQNVKTSSVYARLPEEEEIDYDGYP